MTTTEQTESARILADMRRLVSWLEAHPDIDPIDMEAGSMRPLPRIHLHRKDFSIVTSGAAVSVVGTHYHKGYWHCHIIIDGIKFVTCEQDTATP